MRAVLVVLISLTLPMSALGASPAAAAPAPLPPPVACPGCWHPGLETSWQWQLQGPVDQSPDVQMYDIDLFDNPASVVGELHSAGRIVVCYLDAGTWERFRPDADQFPASTLGKHNGWPGERWLDIRRLSVLKPIMAARLEMCAAKGFDAVEFDNVDGYQNATGFPLTGQEQLRYDTWLANQAHSLGLSAALKNDLGQVSTLLPYFDVALDEQCFQYRECARLQPFLDAGKPVFEVEYKLLKGQFCPQANEMNFNSLRKRLSLKVWRAACR
jgi:hypothetical protein